ncbi:hypothetical protein LEP1GSC187_0778 [Leptospira santarosai str. ZUN179]|uniref:Uncharacterized protein n=1 Tax=Leptospira santarosai str. ZUN179 TaxID=1049985 RepID=M6UWG8_9LEPT|nr:hypothetical protein LEP1GSC187_0778 [Leptospira santarosai str. ZUN179]EMP80019.1 hypothetical protein LEP1GSC162_2769 [Leptospira santarosai str. CBC1531]
MSQTGNSLGVSILKPFIESFFPYQETVINTGNLKLKVPHGHFWFSKSGRRGSRYSRVMPIFFLREFRPNRSEPLVRIDGCFILPPMTKMENESNLKNL